MRIYRRNRRSKSYRRTAKHLKGEVILCQHNKCKMDGKTDYDSYADIKYGQKHSAEKVIGRRNTFEGTIVI